MNNLNFLTTNPSADYELIDSGDGEKLERFGEYLLRRPDPQALWPKNLPERDWQNAHASFRRDGLKGDWIIKPGVPERWPIKLASLSFWIHPSSFKHTGLFPEQAPNWEWLQKIIKGAGRPISVLNLFGYTGGASLAAASAGASVCHVDGSKVAIKWGRDNAELSGLAQKPIRWILDDAAKFVMRELKRGNKYDGIILDPPAFGHGPNKELWKIEDSLLPLLRDCRQIMSDKPLFFLLNGYASGYSALAYANNLRGLFKTGNFEQGELTIAEKSDRPLPCGIYARWNS
ncbi:MAG: SAM-dependent methyltransferase [Candidatus Magasanikbacteria bacterium RIFOXYC2_FULL_42_28]|uniref:SAM-dependent methyltransferase n=1 Tax=Candidatus Magasanikbacteria bacterium RIFOXYC2_FULL_42_28 TaxID=1798704 RepID=A0A1F6NW35_9BACT|nr:MAG: SAM-dependent methyltransferase [Candidatus Magasanikbacteria bacterium RIFOXYC2_FULL_42_28]